MDSSPRDSEFPADLSPLAWVHGELRRSLETANRALRRYLKEAEAVRGSEVDAVRLSYSAATRVIAAKDAEIAARDRLIESLRKKRASPWRRLGDILIGAAAVAVLK